MAFDILKNGLRFAFISGSYEDAEQLIADSGEQALSIADHDPDVADYAGDIPPVITISEADAIRKNFRETENQPVTDSNGITWNGGFQSAIRLDAAKRLAETAGQTTVTFYDVDNIGHSLSIADATSVVMQVAEAFQTKYAAKQAALSAL